MQVQAQVQVQALVQARVSGSERALARVLGLALAWFPGLDQVSELESASAQV